MAPSSACARYNVAREEAMHSIRECKVSREVWSHLITPFDSMNFFSPNLKDFLA